MINLSDLSVALKRKRADEGLTLRDVSRETGVSESTLNRIELMKRVGLPNAGLLIPLASYLGFDLDKIYSDSACVRITPSGSTPDIVEAHLKQDQTLSRGAQAALANLFRAAYTNYLAAQNGK